MMFPLFRFPILVFLLYLSLSGFLLAEMDPVGDLTGLVYNERMFFERTDEFDVIPIPGPHDWLAHHQETGQTYDQYLGGNYPTLRTNEILSILPIGSFGNVEHLLELVNEYTEIFFGNESILLNAAQPEVKDMNYRIHPTDGQLQARTDSLLRVVYSRKPDHAFINLGVCLIDLYPKDDWNFVYGLAIPSRRVGVFSLARYGSSNKPIIDAKEGSVGHTFFKRTLKLMSHEMAHLFGLQHCIYYKCLMNGSNHLDELDSVPMHLCPVCLRKLQSACKFDLVDRYTKLLSFYLKNNLVSETQWTELRLFPLEDWDLVFDRNPWDSVEEK